MKSGNSKISALLKSADPNAEVKGAFHNNEMFIGNDHGIFHLDKENQKWIQKFDKGQVVDIKNQGDLFVASTFAGLVISNDGGENWKTSGPKKTMTKVIIADDAIYGLSMNGGLWESKDYGKTWNNLNSLSEMFVSDISKVKGGILAVTREGLSFKPISKANWEEIELPANVFFSEIKMIGDKVYAIGYPRGNGC